MKWYSACGLFLLLTLAPANFVEAAVSHEDSALKTETYLLGPLKIEGKIPAMSGPIARRSVLIGKDASSPIIWIKSFKVEALQNGMPRDTLAFLCHSWMQLGGQTVPKDERLLTVSQGMAEMKFPPGYAVRFDRRLDNVSLLAQALNDNDGPSTDITYRITVGYIGDEDAQELAIKNLRTVTAAILDSDANAHDSQTAMHSPNNQPMCLGDQTESGTSRDPVSFKVPPGRHEYSTVLAPSNAIYYGGTIHFIKLHLHAYGESASLVDQTTGKTLWCGFAKNASGRALITHVDDYSNARGIRIDPAHVYAVKAVYNNTTSSPVDAMAVLRIYLSDDGLGAVSDSAENMAPMTAH